MSKYNFLHQATGIAVAGKTLLVLCSCGAVTDSSEKMKYHIGVENQWHTKQEGWKEEWNNK